jgi:prepilin-type N-terminal cleavage/methylation domain-containing protein
MFNSRKRRSGFTLPEVLVTVAIVAVLAAAIVPTVVNQMGKGEGASVAADINALTQAVTQFITDTRMYPGDLDHLNTAITTGMASLGQGNYSQRAVNGWKGPYLATTLTADAGYTFSGFSLAADDILIAPSGEDGFITLDLDETPFTGTANINQRLAEIDAIIDGGDGSFDNDCSAGPATAGSTTGRFRWTEAGATCNTITLLRFRLVPTGGT